MISVLCNRTENLREHAQCLETAKQNILVAQLKQKENCDQKRAEETDGLTVVELEGEGQESNERRQLHISPETFLQKKT